MSCRPRVAGEKPHYGYYDPEGHELPLAHDSELPRLQGQSLVSKIAICSLVCCCCFCSIVVALCILSVCVKIPIAALPNQTPPVVSALPAMVSIDQRGLHRHPHIQRSVLKRLAMVRRAEAPAAGVDMDSVRAVFPGWVGDGDTLRLQETLSDVVLALSYLVQGDISSEGDSTTAS